MRERDHVLSQEPFDGIARRTAAGLSRRGSLLALGGAALAAAVTGPSHTQAAKSGKKTRKKARKVCRRQVGQCHDFLDWACPDQTCVDRLESCCASFAKCDANTALQCIFDPQPDEQ